MAKMVEPDNDDIEISEVDCSACNGTGSCQSCPGDNEDCEECEGQGDCNECDGTGTES